MASLCTFCNNEVRPRQEAIECDVCKNWQHRTCETGISRNLYREMCREEKDVQFLCCNCKNEAEPMDTSLPLFADTDDEENEDFNITASISQVTPIQEVSLEDALPSEIQLEPVDSSTDQEVTCEVVPGATKQGKNRLVDDDGYTYVLRRVWPSGKIAWRCSVRSKSLSFNASIQQDGQTFRRGHQPHCHLGKPGIVLTSKMYVDIKRKATDDVFKSASNIVENVIRENSAEVQSQPSCSQPQVTSLVRCANRAIDRSS